ncbi:MAG: hypothetical protein ACREDU_06215, partial [Methylocella sp.]
LIHFGLEAIGDLPGLEELKGAGLFDTRLPQGFGIPEPCDDIELAADEDPLEDDTGAGFAAGNPEAGPEKPGWREDFARAKEALPAPEDCDS